MKNGNSFSISGSDIENNEFEYNLQDYNHGHQRRSEICV